jgi:hypothetical protein
MPYADPAQHRAAVRAYGQTPQGKAARLRANTAYRSRNARKLAAHNAVSKAILRGKLQAWPVCAVPSCSETEVEAHHPDYDAPLSVVWLCDACHKAAHRITKESHDHPHSFR